ncbi:MAG: restriction endonuclease [Bacteroidia bacterium]|nr:restriction endonuclease [Bacteroidia bacterium]
MKLVKVLEDLNSLEKNSLIKIIDNLISESPKNLKQIEKILVQNDGQLKNADNIHISKIFDLLEDQFTERVKIELANEKSHLEVFIDIIIRDGNCIMHRDWFKELYEKQFKTIKHKLREFETLIENEKADIDESRRRDYKVYQACVHMAYHNDEFFNRECKITIDEQIILNTLCKELDLSKEESRLINYLVIPPKKLDIDEVIKELKELGLLLYSKKTFHVFVPDQIVRIIRKLRGKPVADKYFRRVLKQLKDPNINILARRHNINRKFSRDEKIKAIINEGLDFKNVLLNGIFKESESKTNRKLFINNLIEKGLKIDKKISGATGKEKIENLINYFDDLELDEKISISIDGYSKLLMELDVFFNKLNREVKSEFEIQTENALDSNLLLNYNIKPKDILDLIHEKDLIRFCIKHAIKTRGNIIENMILAYKDSENLFIENYINIANRDLATLKENDIIIKEGDLGSQFEKLTEKIFLQLGFNVDNTIKKGLNTRKNKIDLVINLSDNQIIIIECKTFKDKDFNKFSSVSRQIRAYQELAEHKGYKVIKSLLIASEFSTDFVNECGYDYDLNLSLITAETLLNILNGFKKVKAKSLSYKLFLRDVKINEDMILKAISR